MSSDGRTAPTLCALAPRTDPLRSLLVGRRTPERRVRRLAGLLACLLALGCGGSDEGPDASPQPTRAASADPDVPADLPGRFRRAAPEAGSGELTDEQRAMIERLEAIGYATGSREAPAARGVTRYDPERAQPGLNFYVSGHAPEATLMDNSGRVVHRWARAYERSFPDRPPGLNPNWQFWRGAVPLPDGHLLALHEGLGIVKLDRDSEVVWARPYPVHHDLEVTPEGRIVVLTRRAHMVPRISPKAPILEDYVAVLDADGHLLREVSLLEAFENAGEEHSWVEASRRFWRRERRRRLASLRLGANLDIFHTNSVQVLDGRRFDGSAPFRRGNVLISACHLDTVAVVDLETPVVTWSLSDRFQLQHDPRADEQGRLMVFDNAWRPGRSRVAVFDPIEDRLLWQYTGSESEPFYSRTCGTARRLDNGNVLITESDGGRAFEVTRGKEIVWEFYNPARAGENGELIATLFELFRLPEDFGADWRRGEPAP